MGMIQEFKEFLQEYHVMPLAIAFIMGSAVVVLVQSLVSDIIMPVVTPLIPGGDYKTATFALGPILIKWGSFMSALINFIIIAFVIFMLAKIVLKEEKVTKK
ncbi:MAG: Large-conductance mechanosensitive channel [Candidatus Fermentimicrarchaeum limneticum]|uniref:Large-conductance mechanosensitive channel n=1 Tax=Fermentimicrarchaeum limneticum TaxID=2795018 RepID=A0A7D5XBN5_FERL1|nr:MAG: Large-conductance mechanosensitive channel [Candidatus Fermentimicrarchaeum limneticum]